MLAGSISEWPQDGGRVLEPKYDGYRLIDQTRPGRQVRALGARWRADAAARSGQMREPNSSSDDQ
jgi:hypothetical protein